MTTDNYSYMLETGIMGKVSKKKVKGASSKLILPTVSLHCVLVPWARPGPGLGLNSSLRAWAGLEK